MLMIRLQRIGRKNDPSFRMLVLEKTSSPKAGTYADLVGTYNPKTKAFTCDIEKVKSWMSKGAQLSPSLQNLLVEKGLIEGKQVAVVAKSKLEKNVAKKAAEEAAAKEAADAAAAKAAEAEAAAAAAAAAAPAEEAAPAAEAAAEPAPAA
jgi:small subunit ribosomal protein S16